MRIYELIESLKTTQQAQTQLLQTSKEQIKTLFTNSTQTTKDELNKSFETSIQNAKDELESTFTTQLNQTQEQITQENNELREALKGEINTELARIVDEFAKFSKEELLVQISSMLDINELTRDIVAKYELQDEILQATFSEVLQKDIQTLLENLELGAILASNLENYMQNKRDELFARLDYSLLGEKIAQNKDFIHQVSQATQNATITHITQKTMQDYIKKELKTRANEIFDEAFAFENLKEHQFESAIFYQNCNLSGMLSNITKALESITDFEIAKKRAQDLESLPKFEPKQKVYLGV